VGKRVQLLRTFQEDACFCYARGCLSHHQYP
jgi:hypothetical protein